MISTLFFFVLGSTVLLCGNPLLVVAAIPSMATQLSPESPSVRPDNTPILHRVSRSTPTAIMSPDLNEQTRSQTVSRSPLDEQPSPIRTVLVGAPQDPAIDQRRQLVAQRAQKEQASGPRGNSEKELSHELSTARTTLQQARQRIGELERQLAEGNLESAKRRIGELVIQLHAKDSELAALRTNIHENSKKFQEDFAAQTEELVQAKRRVSDVEQQMATTGKGQDVAQTKRRVSDLEQQLTKKDQDLTQIKRRVTEAEQQMAGKEQDLAQAKRRVAELEQQIVGKDYDSAQTKRRATEFEQQLVGKEQDLAQAKRRTVEAEQQTAGKDQELTQTKRRIADLEQQLAAKEQQTAGKTQDSAQSKRRVSDLEQLLAGKEYESAQAKRRATELEQQTAAKEQELGQAKRHLAELEQQMAGKEQDPTQIKRRVTELEQQMIGKEQELGQIRENLKQVTQKYADLGPMLVDRDAEIARTKQLLEELERSLPKPEEAFPSLEVSPPAKHTLSELPPDTNLSVTDLPIPNTSSGESPNAGTIDLIKIGEALSGTLEEELKRGTVALQQERTALTLALINNELFPPGEATITPGGNTLIGQIGTVLQKFRYRNIEVITHTDTRPIRNDPRKLFRDNLELSRARVEHASQALINSGIDADRVKAIVYTTAKPLNAKENRNRNRRIEIVVSSFATAMPAAHGKVQPGKKPSQSISLSSPRRP